MHARKKIDNIHKTNTFTKEERKETRNFLLFSSLVKKQDPFIYSLLIIFFIISLFLTSITVEYLKEGSLVRP